MSKYDKHREEYDYIERVIPLILPYLSGEKTLDTYLQIDNDPILGARTFWGYAGREFLGVHRVESKPEKYQKCRSCHLEIPILMMHRDDDNWRTVQNILFTWHQAEGRLVDSYTYEVPFP